MRACVYLYTNAGVLVCLFCDISSSNFRRSKLISIWFKAPFLNLNYGANTPLVFAPLSFVLIFNFSFTKSYTLIISTKH